MKSIVKILVWIAAPAGAVFAQSKTMDVSPHTVQFITVAPDVKLQVLDWGGVGRPLVFLAGLGGTAHGFDTFALRFTGKYHVYGITRRGYPPSDTPEPAGENYAADRLGDDVLSVLDQLHIVRPVLIAHSFGGEELSSIGSRFPQRVAGLIYLDATYRYAFSPPDRGDFQIDTLELKRRLDAVLNAISPAETGAAIDGVLSALPQYLTDLNEEKKLWAAAPDMSPADYSAALKEHRTSAGKIETAALHGERRYTEIRCPVLAIVALPKDHGLAPGPKRDVADARDLHEFGPLADDFEKGVPTARVVRIAHAKHAVYESNESEVVHEMETFLAGLK